MTPDDIFRDERARLMAALDALPLTREARDDTLRLTEAGLAERLQ